MAYGKILAAMNFSKFHGTKLHPGPNIDPFSAHKIGSQQIVTVIGVMKLNRYSHHGQNMSQ